jgi:hypothetical protein
MFATQAFDLLRHTRAEAVCRPTPFTFCGEFAPAVAVCYRDDLIPACPPQVRARWSAVLVHGRPELRMTWTPVAQ